MKKIISTVGTSLFTNESEFKKDVKPDYENLLEKSNSEWNNYEKKIDKIKENLKNKLDEDSSAEIKSIAKIIEKLGKDEEYELYFLCSDTCTSRMVAEILTDYFNKTTNENTKANFNPGDDVISKLQIDNVKDFKEGMTNLIDRIYQIASGYFENIVLNITGGYKATIPFMTIMGQVNEIPIYYTFENADALISIPHIPLKIDENLLKNHLEELKNLNENPVNEKKLSYEFIRECGSLLDKLQDKGNYYFLNSLGKMLLKKYESEPVVFHCSDELWQNIGDEPEKKKLLIDKYSNILCENKVEKKGEHFVYDDGNNCNRIFFFKDNDKIYIYKIFIRNHDAYESYINKNRLDKQKIINNSKQRKIEREAYVNV